MKEIKLVSLSLRFQKRPLLDLLVTEKLDLELSVIDTMRTKFTRFKTMNMNSIWLAIQKSGKAIRYKNYLCTTHTVKFST